MGILNPNIQTRKITNASVPGNGQDACEKAVELFGRDEFLKIGQAAQ